jgi:hypothetical protein
MQVMAGERLLTIMKVKDRMEQSQCVSTACCNAVWSNLEDVLQHRAGSRLKRYKQANA